MPEMRYFASLPPDELSRELTSRIDDYYQWCLITGRIGRWRMAFDTYYGQRDQHSSQYVTQTGEQGELSFLMSNEFRSIVQQIIVYTTKSRPSIECATINTDASSQEQAILGKQILEYIMREQKIEALAKQALEISMIQDTAWFFTEWDVMRGEPKMANPEMGGKILTKGDTYCSVRGPLDCIIDYTLDNPNYYDWQIKSDLVNKYDLAAQFPEMAEDIIAVGRDKTKDSIFRFGDQGIYSYNTNASPLIKRFTFYHKRTPAMPQGRFFQFLDAKTIITNDFAPFQYESLPGIRVCPTEMISSVMGYSNTNDLLALQDVMDSLMSNAVTNMTTFGMNNIYSKPDMNLNFQQLSDGMGLIEADEKPETLILNHIPPEWFQLTNFVIQRMESISGINSIARGNTAGKDYSGAAMALLQSMAIEFNSGMQMAYNSTLESVFNNILSNIQKYGDEEMEALVAGTSKRYMLKNFKGTDLDKIRRVFIQQGNPFKDTTAGKMAMAEYMLKFPDAIKYPDQITQVLTTGNLDNVLEPEQKQELCIQEENESLSRGEQVPVVWTENHPEHIKEHLCVTWDGDTKRSNPKALQATDAHINEHLQIWQSLDPVKLMVLGIPPFPLPPPPPGAMPMPPGAGAPPSGHQPPHLGPHPGSKPQPPPPPTQAAGGPPMNPASQPLMPKNPLTGQRFDNTTGGMQ